MFTNLRDFFLSSIRQPLSPQAFDQHCYKGLTQVEKESLKTSGHELYEGKVRQCIFKNDHLDIVHTDRLTAFDRHIGYVPYKGVLLAAMSHYWFRQLDKKIDHHLMAQTSPRVLKVKILEPVKAEVVIRGYLAGSMMRAYEKGDRIFCGQVLPDNLKPFGKLPKPILTPTSKAAAFEHDEEQTPEQLIASGVCTRDEWEKIASLSHLIFSIGQDIYRQKGWILVDTKYEFGRDNLGHLFLMDEVHTPDSSRLWVASTYQQRHDAGLPPEMFDKEFIRRFLIEQGFSGYGDVPEVPKEMLFKLALLYLDVAESLLGRHLNSKDCEPELRL